MTIQNLVKVLDALNSNAYSENWMFVSIEEGATYDSLGVSTSEKPIHIEKGKYLWIWSEYADGDLTSLIKKLDIFTIDNIRYSDNWVHHFIKVYDE